MANGNVRTFSSSFLDDVLGGPPGSIPRRHRSSGSRRRGLGRGGRSAAAGNGELSPAERRRQLLQEREDLQVDTEEMERPSFDRENARLNQIVTGVGAVGSLLGALGGSEIAAAAGEGLATGGAQNLQRQRENFRRRRSAFRERLQSAEQFNREMSLSTNEARVRSAEQEMQREADREAAEQEAERQRDLVRLRSRLDNKMTPQEKQKFQRELDLLDARIGAREALTEQREATAEDRRTPDGDGDDERPFSHLTDDQVEQLLDRSEFMVETGFPGSADTDQSGEVDPQERAAVVTGGSLPSTSDIDRVSERTNQLRREAARRGLIDTSDVPEGGAGQSVNLDAEPDSAEVQEARTLVEEGVMTQEEFEELYGEQP